MNIVRLILGACCGVAATAPMSAVMVLWHRRLPVRERYPLPPREITTRLTKSLHVADETSAETRTALTWLAHFAYGGAAGSIYAATPQRGLGSTAMRGFGFGLAVWTVSYLGLLPSIGILKPATEHPARRNTLMIVAHLVWGWALAALYEVLLSDRQEVTAAFHGSPHTDRDARR